MTDWRRYPIRTCVWLNHCNVCDESITAPEQYFDGGYGRRAHVKCVEAEERRQIEARELESHGGG